MIKKISNKKNNKEDKKSHLIELTEDGEMIANKAIRQIEKLDHNFFSKSGNVNELLMMLEKILDGQKE